MNCFCGMVDRRRAFSHISSRDHCQRSSPSRISDTPRAGPEPAQNLSPGLAEWSCAVVTTTTPRRHCILLISSKRDRSSVPWKRPWLVLQVGWDWTVFPSFAMYEAMISPIIFKLSFSFPQCFSLKQKKNRAEEFRKFHSRKTSCFTFVNCLYPYESPV